MLVWLGERRRARNDAWRRRRGSCDHDNTWHARRGTCPKIVLAVALVAACTHTSGGQAVRTVRGSAASSPAVTGDPLPGVDAISDIRATTSTRPTPHRASRSRPAPRRVVDPTQPTRAPAATSTGTATNEQLDALAGCESGRDPRKNTGNGFYGAFQFMLRTWHGMGMSGNPIDYSYEAQRDVARRIPLSAWPRQFPGCSRKLGYR